MVGKTGFEPATSRSQTACTTKLCYFPKQHNCIKYVFNNPVKAGLCANPKDYPYLDFKNDLNNIEEWESDESFIDIEEDLSDERIICDYIDRNSLKIKENIEDLKCLLKYLRGMNMSYRRIENVININREKLRRMCH